MDASILGELALRYAQVRARTEALAGALGDADQALQSMPDASPAKWHRAHVTWFFETMLLAPHLPGYRAFDPAYAYLFNSYYEALGPRHPRPQRGVLSRPTAAEIGAYRAHVDAAMQDLLHGLDLALAPLLELALQHEEQHQELLLTDMLHGFAQSPLTPAVLPGWTEPAPASGPAEFIAIQGGLHEIGHAGPGFGFDNEAPRHRIWLAPFGICNQLARNAGFADFIADGGYATPTLWMSDGYERMRAEGWSAPLHWRGEPGDWQEVTLAGLRPLDPAAPLRHVSWYEADAFARWSGARLPTEAEWEVAAEAGALCDGTGFVWQWTESAYRPYPGFRAAAGAVGEYNGKFMINQMVLRGGSLATPPGHARPSYRNFFHPDKRWQFSGLRLARDA